MKERIIELLASLGKTAEEVAAKLLSLGFKGRLNSCLRCPIANFLYAQGLGFIIEVTGISIYINGNWYPVMSDDRLEGVRKFIVNFDYGQFPELVAHD